MHKCRGFTGYVRLNRCISLYSPQASLFSPERVPLAGQQPAFSCTQRLLLVIFFPPEINGEIELLVVGEKEESGETAEWGNELDILVRILR